METTQAPAPRLSPHTVPEVRDLTVTLNNHYQQALAQYHDLVARQVPAPLLAPLLTALRQLRQAHKNHHKLVRSLQALETAQQRARAQAAA